MRCLLSTEVKMIGMSLNGASFVVLFDEVPLVDDDHTSLSVADNEVVDIQVLGFEPLLSVEHQDADVGVLDGSDRPHYGVEFEVLHGFALFAHTGGVHEVEIHAEFVVSGVDGIAGCSGNGGYDVAFLPEQGVREG